MNIRHDAAMVAVVKQMVLLTRVGPSRQLQHLEDLVTPRRAKS
jgi:hypothetical protein